MRIGLMGDEIGGRGGSEGDTAWVSNLIRLKFRHGGRKGWRVMLDSTLNCLKCEIHMFTFILILAASPIFTLIGCTEFVQIFTYLHN